MKFELIDDALFQKLQEAIQMKEDGMTLVDIVEELKKEGKSQQEVYLIFMEYLGYITDNGTEMQDDYVRDTLDQIYGWGAESAWLFDSMLNLDDN